jgi:D-alanine-D-alanine ligase-like ATP-grasp enzyme
VLLKVAEGLNLPCSPSASVALARTKPATRHCCEAAGLPKVTHHVLNTRSDLQEAIKEVHFPAVMKPISGVSSLGVLRVEKPEDLERVYDESTAHMKSVVVGAGGLLMCC